MYVGMHLCVVFTCIYGIKVSIVSIQIVVIYRIGGYFRKVKFLKTSQ